MCKLLYQSRWKLIKNYDNDDNGNERRVHNGKSVLRKKYNDRLSIIQCEEKMKYAESIMERVEKSRFNLSEKSISRS